MGKKLINKFHGRIVVLLFAVIMVLVSSCGKQKSYPFRIINNSNYDITLLTFSGAVSGEEQSINANETTENLILSYDKRLRLTPKLICLSIDDFVGSGSFNVINNRACLPFSKKDLNDNINTIVITSTESADTITFDITLN